MAVIGTIRKQSGLLIIIVGVALAAFVLGDFLKPRSGRRSVNVAEIDGEEISYTLFDELYEQSLENYKGNQNKENVSADEIFRLRQQTWDQMIQKMVLDNEYQKLGLTVSADELFEQIQGDQPHQFILQYFKDPKTQQYDPEFVRNYIKNLDQMDASARNKWNEFVEAIKEDHLMTKYKNLISLGYFMPDTFIYKDFNEKKTMASIRLIGANYNTIEDSLVNVTDGDFEKYYNDYKQNYKQDASRDLEYVVFDVKASSEDRKAIRENVFEIYEDFKVSDNIKLFVNAESDNRYDSIWYKEGLLSVKIDSIMFNSEIGTYVEPYQENNAWHMACLVDVQQRPDSMMASHILISHNASYFANENITRTRDEAKLLADSLLGVIKNNPDEIGALSKIMSDDPSAAENSGDLGWFADGAMVYPFNNAVLTNNVGDIVVAESQFGFHVIKVTGKLKNIKKVRVGLIDIEIDPSQETFQNYYTKASEFQGKSTSLEVFDTLATSMGYSKRTATVQKMGNRIPGLINPRSIIQWAYIEGIKKGSVSSVFTLDDKYIVACVTKALEDGIPPLEDLKDVLEPLIIKDLKGDVMTERMLGISQETQDLNRIAEKLGSKIDTLTNISVMSRNISGYGNESNVLAKVFNMEKETLSKPIKGNNGAFFVIVDEINEPDANQDIRMYERQMLMGIKSSVNNNSFTKALEEKTEIIDNRVNFY